MKNEPLVMAIKSFVEELRKTAKNWTSVQDKPLGAMLLKAGINTTFSKKVLDTLKKVGFCESEGNLGGMRYRFNEGDIIFDNEAIAVKVFNELVKEFPELQKEGRGVYRKRKQSLKKAIREYPQKFYSSHKLLESVFLVDDNEICEGVLVGASIVRGEGDAPVTELMTTDGWIPKFDYVVYIQSKDKTVHSEKVFKTLDLLVDYLKVRFKKSQDA